MTHERLVLKGRGVEVTLFHATVQNGTITAGAVYTTAPVRAGARLKHENHKYKFPAIPHGGFFLADITITEA
ncbi:hypothetical protein [Deinococcus peraridilitoris]|uniref:Uncharacterized protein n=1 Tax=Deinococcus peraridilitoris (strain DSM 19664 / LMG 22246 / CIP 109416 / KR-200) TaxID=937777 RepID=L0A2A5_DEIPD|nr:hypothetical protein [Deinococcus peraridilitoris]AFZ67574.1 hypothetical protein Deipe_2078 [Deinococcus peraridilitoris DSM 19664]